MAINFNLQLSVRNVSTGDLVTSKSSGVKDTFAQAKEALRSQLQTDANAAAANTEALAAAANQLS